jgi:hypothetical protein
MSGEKVVSRVGGMIVNGVRLSWPLAALTATADAVVLETAFGKKYVIPRAEMKRFQRRWGIFWPNLEIQHRSPSVPEELCFMPLNRRRLVRELIDLGYEVK